VDGSDSGPYSMAGFCVSGAETLDSNISRLVG
jgi:hypothetical protein